jgi:hypothetical protein
MQESTRKKSATRGKMQEIRRKITSTFLRLFHVACLFFILIGLSRGQQITTDGSIAGHVFNRSTHEAIPGANIVILGSTLGASADTSGYFLIDKIPAGTYEVRASAVGFAANIQRGIVVSELKQTGLAFYLDEHYVQMDEILTTGVQPIDLPELPLSVHALSYKEIQNTAGGFDDIVRTTTIMPGVMQTRIDRNDLYVRGGAPSENLFLVDGIEVSNINHFGTQGSGGGSVSFINMDFIENTTFSSGGFGVSYGDRLSSVLAINLREGRTDRQREKVMVSATEASANLEGPLSEQGSYIFSVRRSFLDPLFRLYGYTFAPYYWDYTLKANYRVGKYDNLEILSLGAIDRMTKFNDTQSQQLDNLHRIFSDQTRLMGGFVWRHGFDLGLITLSGSQSHNDINYNQVGDALNPPILDNSYEGESALKGEALVQILSSTEMLIGTGVTAARLQSHFQFGRYGDSISTGYFNSYGKETKVPSINKSSDTSGYKFFAYSQLSQTFGPVVLVLGVRADYFSMIQEKFVVAPRASAAFHILPTTQVTASAGRYYQSPEYVWILGNSYNRALTHFQTDQYVISFNHYFQSDVKMTVEGYIKNYARYPLSLTRPYLVMANTSPEMQEAAEAYESFGLDYLQSSATGFSRGIELFCQKQFSETPMYGRLSISYGEAQFTALDGISRPSSSDQRWKLNLSSGYIYDERWEFTGTFRFSTGRPYTPFTGDVWGRYPNEYNTARTGINHSLDIRVNRKWVTASMVINAYIDIQNIYNKKPSEPPQWDQQKNQVAEEEVLGIVPSIGISIEF